MQEQRPFCSFACKIKVLLLSKVGKKDKNFTTQLIMNKLSPTDMLIMKKQVQFSAIKVYLGPKMFRKFDFYKVKSRDIHEIFKTCRNLFCAMRTLELVQPFFTSFGY